MNIILLIVGVPLVAGTWALIAARRREWRIGAVALVVVALLLAFTLAASTRVRGEVGWETLEKVTAFLPRS